MKTKTTSTEYSRSFILVAFEKDAQDIFEGILDTYLDIDKYFYIRHDKEDDIAPHYHFYVKFKNVLPLSIAQEWLNDINTRMKVCGASMDQVMDSFLQRDFSNLLCHKYALTDVRGNIDLTQFE